MNRVFVGFLILMLTPCATLAQQDDANPVTSAIRTLVERQAKNLVAAAEEMPADKYSFHPTPEQMTFAKLITHIVGEDTLLCSRISGLPAPEIGKLSETDPKDKLVSAFKTSTDFCLQSLAKVDDSKLGENLTLFGGRTATRAAAMINLASDLSDHYSLAATDLRMNGLLPPSAKKKE